MKKILLSLSLLLAFSLANAQLGSLSFSLGLPQNEFQENTDATGFGGDLSFAFPFQKGVPVYFGLDLNYMVYGSNRQNLDLAAEIRDGNGALLASLPIPLRIVNTNSLFGTHAFVRAMAPFSGVQPYAEALFGFRYISTSTRIEDRSDELRWASDPDESNLISRQTVLDDWILSYGFGGGFFVKIAPKVYLDLRANFFKGQRAEYFDGEDTESWTVNLAGINPLQPDDIGGENLELETQPRESTTDLLVIKFGIGFKI